LPIPATVLASKLLPVVLGDEVLRILLIVNSAASSVTARRRVLIQQVLAAKHEVTLAETNRRGHATRLAQSAARDGYDIVAVLGGDGTLNEAANGLAGSATALAPLPGGSTNVFARILGLPDDSVEAAEVILDAIEAGSIDKIGLGSVEGRYFLFHCGVGFDAAVVEQVEKRGPWKRWAGHPLFIYAAVDTWLRRVDRKLPPLRVIGPRGTPRLAGFFTVVMNANPYTFLGNKPFDLVKEIDLDQPLAVVTLEKLKLSTLAPVALAALTGRGMAGKRNVNVRTGVRSLVIEADPPTPYQVDGDHLGSSRRLRFTWTPDHMSLVRPRAGR